MITVKGCENTGRSAETLQYQHLNLDKSIITAVQNLKLNQLVMNKSTLISAITTGLNIMEADDSEETEFVILIGLMNKIIKMKKYSKKTAMIVLPNRDLCKKMINNAFKLTEKLNIVNLSVDLSFIRVSSQLSGNHDIIISTFPNILSYLKSGNLLLNESIHFLAFVHLDLLPSSINEDDLKLLSKHLPKSDFQKVLISTNKINECATKFQEYFYDSKSSLNLNNSEFQDQNYIKEKPMVEEINMDDDDDDDLPFTVCYKEELDENEEEISTSDPKNKIHCKYCDLKCKSKCLLKNHLKKIHNKESSFKCNKCSKTFASYSNLYIHKISHSSERPFKCSQCESTYKYKNHLKYHIIEVHTDDHPFKCDQCVKAYGSLYRLKEHKKVHSSEKPFKCNHCDSAYKDKKNLNKHIREVHNSEHPYKCDQCPKMFVHSSTFNLHKIVHRTEKSFKCSQCDSVYKTKIGLKYHTIKVHTNERPYKCDQCSKKYIRPDLLRIHKQTHEKEKPFKCKLCNKTYKYSCGLSAHTRKQHV